MNSLTRALPGSGAPSSDSTRSGGTPPLDGGLQHLEAVGWQAHRPAQVVAALLRLREHPAPGRLAHRVVAQPGDRAAHRQQSRPERGSGPVCRRERPVAEGRSRDVERLGE
jgi:hypothetical protein